MSLAARLDGLPLSRYHWLIMAISGIGWSFNALNTGIISFVFPLVVKDWGLTPQQVGSISSAQFVGMFIGAAASGGLSDRYGRKTIFQITLAVLCIATGLAGLTWDFWSLMALRFIAGFGMGGMLPVATVLVSEFSPSRHRGVLIVTLDSFWAWGSILAALVAYLLIPVWGWRAALLIGVVPVLYVAVIRWAALESPRYLLARGRRREAEIVVRKVEEKCGVLRPERAADGGDVEVDGAPQSRVSFWELWSAPLRKRTMCTWAMNFAMVFGYYGIFMWLPTLLVAAGHDISRSFEFVLIMNVAQFPGYLVAGYLVERAGRRWTLIPAFLLWSLVSYMLGQAVSAGEIILWGCLVSFFTAAVFAVVWTYTPESYPTRLRATASGWAASFGRIGGIVAPSAVGFVLGSWGGNQGAIFVMFSAVLLLGGAAIAFLGQETKGRSLEDIAG